MHQISVFGNTKDILKEIDPKYENTISGDEMITFYCKSEEIEDLKKSLCHAISSIIQKKYGPELYRQFYNSGEYAFSEEEKKIICSDFNSVLKNGEEFVFKDVGTFLENSNSISVEGFVNFRLSEYKKYMKKQLDKYEEKLEAVREYNDLIELLKAYIETLPSAVKVINLQVWPSGGYAIFNENFRDITEECIKSITENKKITQLSFDDLLLSCLTAAAPEKIIIHNEKFSKTPELILVIKRIFEGKVENCRGCSFCKL